MNKQFTAAEIVRKALTILWDGVGSIGGKEHFACFCVTEAMCKLADLSWCDARQSDSVKPIHARIIQYIDGYDTVGEYFNEKLGKGFVPAGEAQAFRKKMLEEILAEYESEEMIASMKKSDILKEAKEYLAKDSDHYMQPRITMYICHSVSRAISDRMNANPTKAAYQEALGQMEDSLRNEIETRLGTGTFTGAISNLLGDDFAESLTTEQIQTYRHNWLDSLTREYQREGL
jgi:hypothetical protein